MQIKGKQIKDSTIVQSNLNVTTDSIITVSAVTNAEYVNTNSVNRVEQITYATLNLNMTANNATVGELACNTFVIEFPISNVMVRVNNVYVTVGENADCYFSPDSGTTIRNGSIALKGDYLFWNSTRFNLDTTDEIDFVYITASDAVELAGGTTVTLDPYYPALNVKYTGNSGTTMTVVIDSVSFTVGNVGGFFVWDIGGANEHTFTIVGEAILQTVNTVDYTIWYDGLGSLLFSIKKGNFIPNVYFNIGTGFNNTVYTINILDNNKYVVGGGFTTYKQFTYNNILYLSTNGNVNDTFVVGTGFNNYVNSIIQDSNGKYVIGGSFTTYNGLTQNRICRLNQDGSLDTSFDVGTGFGGTVLSIIQDTNGKYVIGGSFTTYKGLTQNRICRLNQDGSLDSTFVVGTGFGSQVNIIIQDSNGKYVIGGNFTTYKGVSQIRICRLEQNGTLDSTFNVGTGFGSQVFSIIQDSNGKYVIGGNFTTYKGLTQNYICRLEQNGTLDTSFAIGTGFNGSISLVSQDSNGKYVLGGNFTTYKGLTQNRICRLNQDGSLDTTFNVGSGFDNTFSSIVQDTNGKYIIGGNFTTYNGLTQNRICRLNQDGSLDTSFVVGTGLNALVYTILINTVGEYIIGGGFTTYNLTYQNYISILDREGSLDTSFVIDTGFGSTVYSTIQDSNGKYVIGGNFSTYKELTQNRICRLNQDGSLDTSFDVGTGFNNYVFSTIQDSNGKYVIVGNFSTYKGLAQNYICRLNQDGSLDTSFDVGTGFNNYVNSIIQDSNGKYVIGGSFTTYNGLTQNRICRLNQDGSLDTSFDVGTGFNNYVFSTIQDSNGKYVIGGSFFTYKGLAQNYICRLNQDGSLDTSFVVGSGFGSQVFPIIQDSNGKYVMCGNFTIYKGLTQNRICRLNQDGSLDTSFDVGTGFDSTVYSLIQDSSGKYVIGGNFTTYKGLTQNRIIRLNQDGSSNII